MESEIYIDLPVVKGALNIEHCMLDVCHDQDVHQDVKIEGCSFSQNDAGPIMDPRQIG
jgi:hypothetical protein